MCVAYLGRLSEDGKVGLAAFGTPFEDSDKVRVQVSVHLLPVHLQDDVFLMQLGTPWVVYLFHHRTHGRLTCGRGRRKGKEEGGGGRKGEGREGKRREGRRRERGRGKGGGGGMC